MVHDQHQKMLVRAGAPQGRPPQRGLGQVERLADELAGGRHRVVGLEDGQRDRLRGVRPLHRLAVLLVQAGAKRLVPGRDVGQGEAQRLGVQLAGEPHCIGDVVGRQSGLEPVEEPQRPLRIGQWEGRGRVGRLGGLGPRVDVLPGQGLPGQGKQCGAVGTGPAGRLGRRPGRFPGRERRLFRFRGRVGPRCAVSPFAHLSTPESGLSLRLPRVTLGPHRGLRRPRRVDRAGKPGAEPGATRRAPDVAGVRFPATS